MLLYHYRSIDSAIKELSNQTFYFASREELNDPIEGYVHVIWQGDKAAWEGLFRNYVCSLFTAIELYLLKADKKILHKKTVLVNIHGFDDVPLGGILKKIGEKFLELEDIQAFVSFYGQKGLACSARELTFVLRIIHNSAFQICIEEFLEHGMIPEDEGKEILESLNQGDTSPMMGEMLDLLKKWEDIQKNSEEIEATRREVFKVSERLLEDMLDQKVLQMEEADFLYTNDWDTVGNQHRNWLSIRVDYPKLYVDQIIDLIYPEAYVVCFSGKCDDSAMWGNYADDHSGVCLIYDSDEIYVNMPGGGYKKMEAKPVKYGGDIIERNFFETFGRLTQAEIEGWLLGREGISECYHNMLRNVDEWRKKYWEAFESKTYRKLNAWEHENEYRLAIDNTFYGFDKQENKPLFYDSRALKGIIFGIRTSEYDKKRIMGAIKKTDDITYYQSEYDDERQKVSIRKKITVLRKDG